MRGEQKTGPSPRKAATLIRLALAEVGAYPVVTPAGSWEEALSDKLTRLSSEDGWALVFAAQILASAPDPAFWRKLPGTAARDRSD